MITPRSDIYLEPAEDAPSDSSPSNRDSIIIGTVVGGVAAIAITAALLFFLLKKRRWDRIRRYEEGLLARRAESAASGRYKGPEDMELGRRPSSSLMSYQTGTRSRPLSMTVPGMGQGQSEVQVQVQGQTYAPRRELDSPPPAYQPLPVYDPSRYQGVSRLPMGVKTAWMRENNSRGEGDGVGVGGSSRPEDGGWGSRVDNAYHRSERGPSPEGEMSVGSRASGDGDEEGERGRAPRRPKPVLSRLVTNF